MKTITVTTEVYQFNELNEDAKQVAINAMANINVEHDWYESTYEDAANVGLKITSFDLYRNRHADGKFIYDADYCAEKIIQEHGKDCETYKTASNYLDERSKLDIDEQEDELPELDEDFLKSICEDYSIILQTECEYLQSNAAIIETIEANEYEFTIEGKRF